jgi:hypothetical protein
MFSGTLLLQLEGSCRVLTLQIFAFKKTSRFYKTGTGFVKYALQSKH